MQKCESRTKRVMSAIIAGMMALQVVAPTISYADDTVASTVSSEDNSDTQIDPGVPVQTDTASSNTVTEPDSSESLEETADSEQTDEIQDDTVSDSQRNETNTQEETVQDTVQQNDSSSETTESESVRTVTVTLNKNGGIFEPEWLETANEDPIAAYLGTETNDIAIEDTGDTIVATVTDRDSISIPVALSSDESLYFTGWDVSSGSYDADNETLTFDDGVDAYVLTAVYNSVADEDQQLIENKEIFDEQAEKNVLQQKLSASGISLYEMRPSDSYNQLDLIIDGLAFTSDDGLVQTFTAPYDGDYTITAYGANGGTGKGKYQGYRTPGRGGKAEGTIHLSAGQTIHIYLGEAGGYWSTNRTFGGGGGQIDWDRAWFPDEDNGQTDRYHVFGRGGGATYVTVDAWTMDQAGEAAHDYTDAEKAQNDAAAEVAKNHVILLAGGGGGMGESGGSAGGGGLEGQGPVANRYYVDETKNITITKAWNDGNNQDGLRPKTITAVVNGSDGSARFVQLFEGQNWATNLNNLPKYKNGTEIQYTVKENAIPGYETEIKQTGDSYAITNSHTPAVVTVSAVKVWDDANNQDGIRPSLIQVTLTGFDGSVRNAAITKNDGWTYQFKNLPKYKNGVKIDYTLQEANSNPYTYEIVKGSDEYSFTITNNYVPAVVNVPITTVWDDDDNRDGIRAKETVITLHGSNGKTYQRIVTGKDSFATVFENMPKFFDEGKEVVYTVTQNEMNGYTANIANTDKYTFQITNTHEPEKLTKTVAKVWDDNNNQDGLRPNTLRIALTGTDGTYIEKSLSTANNWTETFDGLYKYFKEGTPIQYTIDEEAVGGYEKGISEKDNLITITNTHAPEKLDLIVNVVWNDANNQDGYRPDAATIHMSGTDGTQDAKDFTKDSSWSSIVFKDLDHYKDGNEIKYTVAEDEIPQYTTSIAVNGNVVTVTNTHIPEITLRNISVIWDDNNDQDGLRPDTVSIKLKGNDKFIDSSELNEDVKWKHSFTKLPVRENGNEITYTAEENEIPGYTTSIEKTDTGYVFTNTHIPETVTVTVDKVWKDAENQDGLRPDAIQIRLISNDIEKDAYLDAESDWHLDFEGLPKYRDHGILNEYSVQEVDVDGYTSTVTTEDGYTFTIENDHVPAVIDIPITEEWIDDNDRDGLRPDSHTVVLVDGTNAIEEAVLDRDNGYGVVLKNMPKYKNGVEINYQIKDFKVDGYTTNIIKSDSVKDFNITNTHVPEMVTVTVTEGWHDQSDYDKIRPEKVTLTLTGSDGNVYEKTVTKDTWTTVFSDLPKNSKGEQIIYTLTQEGIKGYKTTITDNETGTIAVVNTHEPVKTITVTVTWNDENNKDNIRPDKVTVKLANGTTAVSTKEINNDSWKHVFENIIVFNGSDKVSYTVTQDAVSEYTTEIKASDDGNTIEIINTHVPVAPPKEEPKQEETVTPAAPAPVVEIKTEPTTTVIETPNKQTGISFMDGLFG